MSGSCPIERITAVVLAGGRGLRMGGEDKGLIPLRDKPLVAHVLETIRPQVNAVFINANRHHDRYSVLGVPVIADEMGPGQFWGPLAGIAAALQRTPTEYLLTVPCDAPILPPDLVARLWQGLRKQDAEISVVHDGRRMQAVVALWKKVLAHDLTEFVARGGRQVQNWVAGRVHVAVDFSDVADAFVNVNTVDDLSHLLRTSG